MPTLYHTTVVAGLGMLSAAVAGPQQVRHMWACGRPDPSLTGAGFTVLADAQHRLVYQASREHGAYSHHARLYRHGQRFHAMWSNHRHGEDGPGQRVLWSRSEDGKTWEPWQVLFPSPVPMVSSEQPGFVLTAGGWHTAGNRLFALASCTVVTGFENSDRTSIRTTRDRTHIFRRREGRSRIAREVNLDGTLGPVFLLGLPPPERDQLAFDMVEHTNPRVAQQVHDIVSQFPRRRLPEGIDSNRLCEPTVYTAADGRHVMLLRDDCYSHRMYVSVSDDGQTWPPAVPTDIPDSPSLSTTLVLADRTVLLIGNHMAPEFDNPGKPSHYGRDPLTVAVSQDGYCFTRAYALRCGQQHWRVPRTEVKGRGGGAQYPSAMIHNDCLCVLYSMGKEDVWFSSVPLTDLGLTPAREGQP